MSDGGEAFCDFFITSGEDARASGRTAFALLDRLVRVYARRFTVQERLGEQIADTLVDLIDPRGVAVHLEAAHLCTQMRGVNEESSRTVTSFWRGLYSDDPDLRREFLDEVRSRR